MDISGDQATEQGILGWHLLNSMLSSTWHDDGYQDMFNFWDTEQMFFLWTGNIFYFDNNRSLDGNFLQKGVSVLPPPFFKKKRLAGEGNSSWIPRLMPKGLSCLSGTSTFCCHLPLLGYPLESSIHLLHVYCSPEKLKMRRIISNQTWALHWEDSLLESSCHFPSTWATGCEMHWAANWPGRTCASLLPGKWWQLARLCSGSTSGHCRSVSASTEAERLTGAAGLSVHRRQRGSGPACREHRAPNMSDPRNVVTYLKGNIFAILDDMKCILFVHGLLCVCAHVDFRNAPFTQTSYA